jgi:SAM-dependent methyltransferase
LGKGSLGIPSYLEGIGVSAMNYDPRAYWEQRFAQDFSLGAAGHIGLGEEFNMWVYRIRAKTLRRVIKNLGIDLHGKKVLDIGCGTGFWVDYWLRQGAEAITGMDIAETSIRGLRERYPLHKFVVCDIQQQWPVEGKFDIISAFAVLNHIVDEKGFDAAIASISRSLAPGGYLFISDGFLKRGPLGGGMVCWRTFDRYHKALLAQDIEVVGVFPLAVFIDTACGMEFTRLRWINWSINRIWHRVTRPCLESKKLGSLCRGLGLSWFCIDQILLRFLKDGPSMKLMVARPRQIPAIGTEDNYPGTASTVDGRLPNSGRGGKKRNTVEADERL